MQRIGISCKPDDQEVLALAGELRDWLQARQCSVLLDRSVPQATDSSCCAMDEIAGQVDLMVVLGGDGTLLHAARRLIGSDVPILGINLGRLGFLTDTPVGSMFDVMREVLRGRFKTKRHFSLCAETWRGGERKACGHVINDLVIERGALPRMIEFEMFVRDQFVFRLRADGLILATPAGSTAYALSAGGAIVHPEVEAISVVPVCPHTLSNRPIIIPANDRIELHLLASPGQAALNLDGQEHLSLQQGDRISVRKGRAFSLVYLPERHYFEVLRTKLNWAGQLETRR
ncbi:MAG: hypothetical protein D6678_06825 [Zetaproteobacteria bacterium]|nr:MAG: hypothetical protein D6678_06825 [Zetaproteobacteria bacterium]